MSASVDPSSSQNPTRGIPPDPWMADSIWDASGVALPGWVRASWPAPRALTPGNLARTDQADCDPLPVRDYFRVCLTCEPLLSQGTERLTASADTILYAKRVIVFRGYRRVPRPNALSCEDGWDMDVRALWSGYLAGRSALLSRRRGQG